MILSNFKKFTYFNNIIHSYSHWQHYIPQQVSKLCSLPAKGTVTIARTLLSFQETLNSKTWVIPGSSENGENTSFNYDASMAGGYNFINRIINHEKTHVGPDVNGLPVSVLGFSGSQPSWVGPKGSFSLFGLPFTLYHRGDVFEKEAYLKHVTYADAEYGFAVNVYFRLLGGIEFYIVTSRYNTVLSVIWEKRNYLINANPYFILCSGT